MDNTPTPAKAVLSVREFCDAAGISRSKFYIELAAGHISARKCGSRTLMTTYNSYGNLTEDEQLEAVANIGKGDADLQSISTDVILAEAVRRMGR